MKQFKQHQGQSKNLFSKLKEHQKLEVGTSVLLRLKQRAFRKEQNPFQPRWSKEKYVIERVDKSLFPPLYSLRDFPIKNRRYMGTMTPVLFV